MLDFDYARRAINRRFLLPITGVRAITYVPMHSSEASYGTSRNEVFEVKHLAIKINSMLKLLYSYLAQVRV